jgi:hypothetical protein
MRTEELQLLNYSWWFQGYNQSMTPVEPASIAPNPSAGAITLTISEDVTSYKLVNDQGQVSYSGGSLSVGEGATFGEQLRSGQYVLVIQYVLTEESRP